MQVSGGGAYTQAALTQLKISTSVLKTAAESERQIVDLISKTAEQIKGRNLDTYA